MRTVLQVRAILKRHAKAVAIVTSLVLAVPLASTAVAFAVIQPNQSHILPPNTDIKKSVGLVLGSGITADGKPFRELQSRLDTAAAAWHAGTVDTLILSGDNRFEHYNEPAAMMNYLVNEKQVDSAALQPDYAGRSTYESCERAAKVFQLNDVILFSAESHLPRAIYLCRHFGIEAYGIASQVEANNSSRRELLARVKAVYNAHVNGEDTILGDPIVLDTSRN